MTTAAAAPATGRRASWLKRIGVVRFLFFLVKGLVWIALAIGAWPLR
jgi:hypothetical protein